MENNTQKTDLVLSIPREYGEEFVEKANNIPTEDLKVIDGFLRQGIRARMSCILSKVTSDKFGNQILDCNFPLDTEENCGMSTFDMQWVNYIVQYQGGEIDIIFDCQTVSFEQVNTDILLYILEQITNL